MTEESFSRSSAPQPATRCCARRPALSRRTFGRDNWRVRKLWDYSWSSHRL